MGPIILFIIASLISYVATVDTLVSIIGGMAKEVADFGYIIDLKKLYEVMGNESNTIKNMILLFTPFANFIYANYVRGKYLQNKGLISDKFISLGFAYKMSDYQMEQFKKEPTKMNALLLMNTPKKESEEVLTAVITSQEGSGKIFYKSDFNEDEQKYNFEILGVTDSFKDLSNGKVEELLFDRFIKMAEFNQNVTGTTHELDFRKKLINEYEKLKEDIVILNTYLDNNEKELELSNKDKNKKPFIKK